MANKLPFDIAKINALLSPAGMRQLNSFLEELPQRFGINLLIIAAIIWGGSAVLVFYTTLQAKEMLTLRSELMKTESIVPIVPQLTKVPVTQEELEKFVKSAKIVYPNIEITASGNQVSLKAPSNLLFGKFREVIFQTFNAGKDWRVDLATLCLGRECIDKGGNLLGSFGVSRYTVVPTTGNTQ